MKKILIACFFATVLSNSTFANTPFSNTKVGKLIVHDSGAYIIVVLKSPVAVGEGCASSSEIKLKVNHPLFKIMYATLL